MERSGMNRTVQDLVGAFERLEINDGDVILLRGEHDYTALEQLTKTMNASGRKNVTLWVLADGQTVETMDEDQMREAGWVRANTNLSGG